MNSSAVPNSSWKSNAGAITTPSTSASTSYSSFSSAPSKPHSYPPPQSASSSYYGSSSKGTGSFNSYGNHGSGNNFAGGGDNFGLGYNLSTIDFSKADLIPFEKNFYMEHPDVQARSEQDAAQWRAAHQIVVVGHGVPKPCLTFEEASMPEYVLSEVLKQGFSKPTPIQSQGWPMALLGRNMVGISATGSGKTLAFLLPAMIHINAQVSSFFLFFYRKGIYFEVDHEEGVIPSRLLWSMFGSMNYLISRKHLHSW
jgi:hypothetical protein